MDVYWGSRGCVGCLTMGLLVGCGGSVATGRDAAVDAGSSQVGADMGDGDNTCPVSAVMDSGMAAVIVPCERGKAIAVAGPRLFWGNAHLRESSIDGTSPTVLGQQSPVGIAANLTDVYWTDDQGGYDGRVYRVPLSGGEPTVVASGQDGPWDVVVDNTSVYWANSQGTSVVKVPLLGGTPVVLVQGDGLTGVSAPRGIALDDTNVYWGNNNGTIMSVAKNGGAPVTLAQGQDLLPKAVAVDGTSVYWTNNTSAGMVMKVLKSGGMPSVLATTPPYTLVSIATDGVNVYWAENDPTSYGGSIKKVSVNGGTPVTLASQLLGVQRLTLDDTNVYWTTGNGIMKGPK